MDHAGEIRIPLARLKALWWDVSAPLDVVVRRAGLPDSTVRLLMRRRKRLGWPSRHRLRRAGRYDSVKMRALWADDTLSVAEIGKVFGLSARQLGNIAAYSGFPPRRLGPKVHYDLNLFRRAWLAGVSSGEIARSIGRDQSTLSSMARREGLPPRRGGFQPTMTLAQFLASEAEAQLAAAMAADAARVRAAHAERAAAERRVLSDFSGEIAA